ncbi:PH domain-containing protein [Paenibacillus sp. TH7-28]
MALFKSGENREKHIQQLQEFLFEGEQIERTYGLSSDFVALTNKRLIYVDARLNESGRLLICRIITYE